MRRTEVSTPAASRSGLKPTPLIFVLGGARSGTTLLGRILGSHPQVLRLGETHFFETIWAVEHLKETEGEARLAGAAQATLRLFERYGQPAGQQAVEAGLTKEALLETAMEFGGGSLGLLRGFAYLLSAAAGKTIFCDDTPRHVFFLDVIFAQLPEARVVACLRDPRDYLASYKYHWRRAREPERVRAIYHPVITSILWRRTWLAATGATGAEGRLILNRYEDLVTRPEEQVRRLCSFLDLDFHPDMLSIEGSNSSFGDGQRGVFTSSVGRFRAVLTAEETWACQRINAPGMRLLGYEPVVCRPNPVKAVAIAITTIPALLRGLYANRKRRGALLPYLKRRLQRPLQ